MKKLSIRLVYCLTILNIFSCEISASSSSSSADLKDFTAAGFTVQPLSALVSPSEDSFQGKLVKHYKSAERVFVVTNYPKATGKTETNYAPLRAAGTPFDTVVMSRLKEEADGTSDLPRILGSWIQTGFSSHAIVTLDGTIAWWVDPTRCKGQMAGPWNAHSVEVLVATDSGQNLADAQIRSLGSIVSFAQAVGEEIKHLVSHGEARGSESEGTIVNLDKARQDLGLTKNPKAEHNQTALDEKKS
ncbi:hypothetical protein [Candidatus Finniella inopinata]|uniref:N-acetylmuramoyl-L-alanine amidase n=1 Tax=Candidatus Finniella inopinata TaxID=1696036 RepID=A0A4Q7DIA4_9PROT|nr:hypothetical protein [Candidatus Finniella inopinata]RZI45909.1 hypothetical protein EQU50_05620 [Candidatus Finniella inopinata]